MRTKLLTKLAMTKKISTFNLALTAILALVLFLVVLGNLGRYQSQITFIMIPRNPVTIMQAEQIAQNLERLPGRLAFYEKLLKENARVVDNFSQQTADQRKKSWNKVVKIQREDNTLAFNLTAYAKTKSQAEVLARQSTMTLFAVMANYYDVKNDLDLRIVDGPITAKIGINWLLSIVLCLGAAALLVAAINFSFGKLEHVARIIFPAKGGNLPHISIPKEWQALTEKKDVGVIAPTKKYQPPSNLPVAPTEELPPVTSEALEADSGEKKEPTDEELKRRLNELLSGENKVK